MSSFQNSHLSNGPPTIYYNSTPTSWVYEVWRNSMNNYAAQAANAEKAMDEIRELD